jgi:hypothetical protein
MQTSRVCPPPPLSHPIECQNPCIHKAVNLFQCKYFRCIRLAQCPLFVPAALHIAGINLAGRSSLYPRPASLRPVGRATLGSPLSVQVAAALRVDFSSLNFSLKLSKQDQRAGTARPYPPVLTCHLSPVTCHQAPVTWWTNLDLDLDSRPRPSLSSFNWLKASNNILVTKLCIAPTKGWAKINSPSLTMLWAKTISYSELNVH